MAPRTPTVTNAANIAELHTRQDLLNADAEITRLTQLSTLNYERERETAAKQLGIRLPVLDNLVARARQAAAAAEPSLPVLPAIDTAFWPEPVNGAQLLDQLQPPSADMSSWTKEPLRRPPCGLCIHIVSTRSPSRQGLPSPQLL